MNRCMISIISAALALGTGHAVAQDVSVGKALYSRACASCHGPAGQGLASFPSLQGRDAEYIANRLRQYRAGERVGANTALMAPNAADLSDADISALADYISSEFR